MLALKVEAQYEAEDGVHDKGMVYPVVALTVSDELEGAVECLKILMGENGWNEIDIKKYGTVKDSKDVPDTLKKNSNWESELTEFGVIYIVYK